MFGRTRFGLGTLATLLLAGCDDNIDNPAVVGGSDGSTRDPLEIAWNGKHECTAACCPQEDACYVSGKSGPGAECLATRNNAGQQRLQFRQTWIYPTSPGGLTRTEVYAILNAQTQLKSCATPNGAGGYIQLLDVDQTRGISRVGWARRTTPEADAEEARGAGLCMARSPLASQGWTSAYNGRSFNLAKAELYEYPNLPPGGLQPLPQPWLVMPTVAEKVAVEEGDFELTRLDDPENIHSSTSKGELTEAGKSARRAILKRLENRADGVNGVYFANREQGYVHGFGVIAYQLIYDALTGGPFIVPIREAETFQKVTDVAEENCIGWYRRSQIDIPGTDTTSCPGSSDARDVKGNVWAGVDGRVGVGDAWTKGYFLIAELEQIFVPILDQTLCVAYQAAPDTSFTNLNTPRGTPKTCRDTGKWNSTNPKEGMPRGDWCSETNGPATDECHDAFLTIAYHAFAASNVQDAECAVDNL